VLSFKFKLHQKPFSGSNQLGSSVSSEMPELDRVALNAN